jgi:hypothetical protein
MGKSANVGVMVEGDEVIVDVIVDAAVVGGAARLVLEVATTGEVADGRIGCTVLLVGGGLAATPGGGCCFVTTRLFDAFVVAEPAVIAAAEEATGGTPSPATTYGLV